jgi:hypothetical protein
MLQNHVCSIGVYLFDGTKEDQEARLSVTKKEKKIKKQVSRSQKRRRRSRSKSLGHKQMKRKIKKQDSRSQNKEKKIKKQDSRSHRNLVAWRRLTRVKKKTSDQLDTLIS